ncbi:addiction module protein [Pseudomonas abyssi]|uniref:Protein adenylyltransferase n=1 Tax=Pseudomonas abyssi TaxID=170540 RepID=A0A2A3MFC6_9PSED|nr:Fic/DOC family N-terminal domain-containing protein [Pseudomonas abyssi]MAC99136.1 Fic family protein [Pseudomonadales bacterium]PBK03491.1 addiction module protein [Pseudomonas abyssi]|tara:strand:- start:5677 stop:6801 length:1125 start_codon:yes stop_codon:yes gene_type:complete
MTWHPEHPYNTLPLLPPDPQALESIPVLKACIGARAALAELKQAGELLPNQTLLINLLPLLEAKDSSEIENIVTTMDRLFQFAQEDSAADAATKEALRYRTALYQGYRQLQQRPLCVTTATDICSTLKGQDMTVRKIPGTVIANQTSGEVVYTPPVGEAVIRNLLANWEQFLHASDDTDPLIKMAVSHYQFEAIHPFLDGNGRTGRIVNVLYLIEQQLLTLPILYLSRYIVQHKQDYYRLLTQVTRDADWQAWIVFMLKGVEGTSIWTCAKIAAIRQLMEHTSDHVRNALPKIYSHELLQLIFEQPYCRISDLVERQIAKRQTASVYLKQLCDVGVLSEIAAGKEKLFVHPKLVTLMTYDSNAFAAYPQTHTPD